MMVPQYEEVFMTMGSNYLSKHLNLIVEIQIVLYYIYEITHSTEQKGITDYLELQETLLSDIREVFL